MASVIEIPNMRLGYGVIIDHVLGHGTTVAPRGIKTVEILNPTIVVTDPADTLPAGVGRNLSPKIAAVEAVQLCGGFADAGLTVTASHHFERYREPGGNFHGAYGRRIAKQAQEVAFKLNKDPDSRQAVITLWDPAIDNLGSKRDYPCTVSLQFLVRSDKLLLSTNMRSNDVWLGLAYDIFQFSQLQWTVANELGIEAGPLTHRPVSLHAYEHDLEKMEEIAVKSTAPPGEYRGFRSVTRAWHIGHGDSVTDPSPTELWFAGVLRPLLAQLDGGI